MRLDQLNGLRSNIELEQEEARRRKEGVDTKLFSVSRLIEVLTDATKSYNEVNHMINAYSDDITKSEKSYPTLVPDYRKKLEYFQNIKDSGFICIKKKDSVCVSWWCPNTKHHNPDYQTEVETLKRRHEVVKAICDSLGIGYSLKVEDEYYNGIDEAVVNLYSGYRVPIAMLENEKEPDMNKVTSELEKVYGLIGN